MPQIIQIAAAGMEKLMKQGVFIIGWEGVGDCCFGYSIQKENSVLLLLQGVFWIKSPCKGGLFLERGSSQAP